MKHQIGVMERCFVWPQDVLPKKCFQSIWGWSRWTSSVSRFQNRSGESENFWALRCCTISILFSYAKNCAPVLFPQKEKYKKSAPYTKMYILSIVLFPANGCSLQFCSFSNCLTDDRQPGRAGSMPPPQLVPCVSPPAPLLWLNSVFRAPCWLNAEWMFFWLFFRSVFLFRGGGELAIRYPFWVIPGRSKDINLWKSLGNSMDISN